MRVDVTPYYENTTMQAYYNSSNVLRAYIIAPVEGYVMHLKGLDKPVFDDNGEETGEVLLGYSTAGRSVPYNYDFEANPYEIYAVPENSVPADQIFGGGDDNEHEVM